MLLELIATTLCKEIHTQVIVCEAHPCFNASAVALASCWTILLHISELTSLTTEVWAQEAFPNPMGHGPTLPPYHPIWFLLSSVECLSQSKTIWWIDWLIDSIGECKLRVGAFFSFYPQIIRTVSGTLEAPTRYLMWKSEWFLKPIQWILILSPPTPQ